jgi:hypothetical protein
LSVGRTPWSAADARVGLLALCEMPTSWFRMRDEGWVRPTSRNNDVALG